MEDNLKAGEILTLSQHIYRSFMSRGLEGPCIGKLVSSAHQSCSSLYLSPGVYSQEAYSEETVSWTQSSFHRSSLGFCLV